MELTEAEKEMVIHGMEESIERASQWIRGGSLSEEETADMLSRIETAKRALEKIKKFPTIPTLKYI